MIRATCEVTFHRTPFASKPLKRDVGSDQVMVLKDMGWVLYLLVPSSHLRLKWSIRPHTFKPNKTQAGVCSKGNKTVFEVLAPNPETQVS